MAVCKQLWMPVSCICRNVHFQAPALGLTCLVWDGPGVSLIDLMVWDVFQVLKVLLFKHFCLYLDKHRCLGPVRPTLFCS